MVKEELKYRIVEPAQLISIIMGVSNNAQKEMSGGRIRNERKDILSKDIKYMVEVYIDGEQEQKLFNNYFYNK